MRGKAQNFFPCRYGRGITPACAGKRWPATWPVSGASDHPRVCGEKSQTAGERARHTGSPPRVRGKGRNRAVAEARNGITPACAGKRSRLPCSRPVRWDHPRVCGEKLPCPRDLRGGLGSPPRVRGKGCPAAFSCRSRRITPACAGKRGHGPVRRRAREDHPRVCGEKLRAALEQSARDRDHPRVCGEKLHFPPTAPPSRGSPPRVRGKELLIPDVMLGLRITPACAGKSRRHCLGRRVPRDHPRVCGEKRYDLPRSAWERGSPPRVRGKVRS